MPVPTFVGAVLWTWVGTFYIGYPFLFPMVYATGLVITYMVGGLFIGGPNDVWFLGGRFLLVVLTSILAWVCLISMSVRMADYGKLFSFNRGAITFISSSTNILSIVVFVAITILAVIYEFVAMFGIGYEIALISAHLIIVIIAWLIMYRVGFPRSPKVHKMHIHFFVWWVSIDCSVGVIIIGLSLLFRLIVWPLPEPNFWSILSGVTALTILTIIVLTFAIIRYYMDRERHLRKRRYMSRKEGEREPFLREKRQPMEQFKKEGEKPSAPGETTFVLVTPGFTKYPYGTVNSIDKKKKDQRYRK